MTATRHLTTAELAERLRLPEATVKYWRVTGYGPRPMHIGKHVRYRETDIEAWEKSRLQPA